jgi:hypothetical protein
MARRPEISGRKPFATAADDVDAYSVIEFCRRHGISPQLFYKFKDEMPATFRIGVRVLISRESAARWRAEREAAVSTIEAAGAKGQPATNHAAS